ncbi:MAG: hypothetical protein R2752_21705 [Vicinamibacterales bacterium]
MDATAPRQAIVINLAEYRRQRAEAQAQLPLFAVPVRPAEAPAPPPRRLRGSQDAGRLDTRAITHRERMLRFLTGR